MTIKKLGHCCLLIRETGAAILTDPGVLSTAQNEVSDIDAVLITHEHADHLHIESLKKVLAKNPHAAVVVNASVGVILEKEGIAFKLLEDGGRETIQGTLVEAFGNEHAEIYNDFSRVQNTGFFIAGKLFYPGDAFYVPPRTPEVLALPVAGPWMRIKEAIDYAKTVKPHTCFPVHDGIVSWIAPFHDIPKKFLSESGIEFTPILSGEEKEF